MGEFHLAFFPKRTIIIYADFMLEEMASIVAMVTIYDGYLILWKHFIYELNFTHFVYDCLNYIYM